MSEILSEEELAEIERIRDPNVMWKELPTVFDSHRALHAQVHTAQVRITELEAALQASHG